jgi:hypothetical protein
MLEHRHWRRITGTVLVLIALAATGLALLSSGCAGSADARLRAAVAEAADAWSAYDAASAPAADLDEEDRAAREKVRRALTDFFATAKEVQ